MNRYTCPQNPECYVDCPFSGYAYYKIPYGPCETGCDEAESMKTLFGMIANASSPKIFSGSIAGVRAATLSQFAVNLIKLVPDAEALDVAQLEGIATLYPDRRFSAEWSEVEPREIVRILAESTRGNQSGGSEKKVA